MPGQTIAEKVLSSHSLSGAACRGGEVVEAKIDGLLAINYEQLGKVFERMGFADGPPTVFDPRRTFLMNDHVQPPATVAQAEANRASARIARELGLTFYRSEMGIGHQIMMESGYVRPGELVVGNDSHTIAYGALNAVSTGIGADEAAYVWCFGELYFTVPESIQIRLKGAPRSYPFAKDIVLYLAGLYGDSFAQGKAIEFAGPLSHKMNLSSRMTFADHAVELGAKFATFLYDDQTESYLRAAGAENWVPVEADAGARYAQVIEIDCDRVGFQVARPFRFDDVVPVEEAAGTRIDQARVGSCANGRFEDIEVVARILRGRHVAEYVKFYVSPASIAVYRRCADAGIVSELLAAGAQMVNPGCSICQSPGIVLNEEVCITSTTRNYRGRLGGATCADAKIYLAGPATVAAAAVAGEIVDPREFLGE